jgi:hypothetical protein
MGWNALAQMVHRASVRTFRQDLGALYVRQGYPDTPITDVVFDDTYFAVNLDTGVEQSSKRPIMGVNTADLPTPRDAQKDRIILNGITFSITDVQPDGEAGTTLFLSQSINRTP